MAMESPVSLTQQVPCGGLILAVKEEDGESGCGERRGSGKESIVEESALRAEYPVSSAEDIKTEQVQEEEDESHLAPVFSSEAASSTLSLADPLHLVQLSRVPMKLVDCCRTGQHGTEKNREGEQQKSLDTGIQDIVPLTSCSLSVVLELDTGVQDIVPLTSCSLSVVLELDTGVQDIVPLTSCSLSVVLGLDTSVQDIVPLTSCSLSVVLGLDTVMLNVILCSSCCLGTGGSKSSAHRSDSAGMQTSVIAVTRGSS
ncbi:uncharacterized protein LOC125298229 [Alosa alosa]|uniref:uncharacterized protein LOC125298229 n=1 Tax=Alosa alosa TaxID=278164 RepID=UPI002015122B|nr:uncharacterized protein LOC125298229 [Alosa alosa]